MEAVFEEVPKWFWGVSGFKLMFNKGILSWSLMPGMLCVLSMREGFVVRKRYRMFLPVVCSRTSW